MVSKRRFADEGRVTTVGWRVPAALEQQGPPRRRGSVDPRMRCAAGFVILAGAALAIPALPATRADSREIPIVLALDASARSHPEWRAELDRGLAEANGVLGRLLGRRFALVEVVSWSPRPGSLETLLDELRVQVPGAGGRIVTGLTGERPDPADAEAIASYRDASLVIAAPASLSRWRRLLVHELAHIFGAVHLEGERGLMAERGPGLEVDPLSERLLAFHRARRFSPRLYPLPAEDLRQALDLYREAARRSPLEARAHVAQIALEIGEYEQALEAADSLLALDSRSAEAHNLRGIALRRLGRVDEAVAAYREVLARRPGFASGYHNLALALDRLGRLDEAVSAYERAVAFDPAHVTSLSNLARLHARRGESGKALACARRALEVDPDFAEAGVNLAMAHLAADQPDPAEQAARRAVAERPRLAEAHEALGAALLAQGRTAEAAASFETAAGLSSEEPRFRHQLAVAYLAQAREELGRGRTGEALEAFGKAMAAEPDGADVVSEVAEGYFRLGRRLEAREVYRRLLRLRPEDVAAHNNLAVVLYREGDLEGARRHAREARRLGLAVHPDFLKALGEVPRR